MKILYKWIVFAGLLLAALISYGYGFSQGVIFFVALGAALELIFWFGVFGKKQQCNEQSHR